MFVSIEMAMSLTAIFSLLANLQTPVTCSNTYSIISQLNPPQNVNYESLKYQEPIKTNIKKAWNYAHLAKLSSQKLASNTYLCAYLNMPIPKGMEVIIQIFLEALTKTKTNYYAAINQVSNLYSFELKQAEQDYINMDKAGFDVLNNSFEKLQFEKAKKLLTSGNENTKQSNVYELQSVQEAILYNLKKGGLNKGVVFFNQFIGKEKGIDLYEQNHKDAEFLLANLDKKYKNKKQEIENKRKFLEEKIKKLEQEGVGEMDAGFQNQLSSHSLSIAYSSSNTPKEQLFELQKGVIKTSTEKASFIYSLKKDNYLAEAYLILASRENKLNYYEQEADILQSKLEQIEKTLHKKCLEELSETKTTSPIYFEIKEKCNANGNLKEKILKYSEAIKTAKGDYSDYLYLEDFIENSLKQLPKTGIHLSLEEKQFENIKHSEAPVSQKYSSLLSLKKEIEEKAKPVKQSFEKKQRKLHEFLSAVEEKRSVFTINNVDLQSDKDEADLMDLKDFCPNAFDLLKEQENLLKKYEELISKNARNYFESKEEKTIYFKTIPQCNKQQKAVEIVSVYNDLASLEDVSLDAVVFGKKEEIFIPFFKEETLYSKQFEGKMTPLSCSSQEKQVNNNTFILTRTVNPLVPLQKAKIKFDLPEDSKVISSSGLFDNGFVYIDSIEKPADVFVIFSFSTNLTASNEDSFFNDSFFLNKTIFNSTIPKEIEDSLNYSSNYETSFSSSEKHDEKKDISSLSSLMFAYKKAVDDEVQISHAKTSNNYTRYEKEFNKLTGLSVDEFNKKEPSFELSLKNEINSLKEKAEEEYNQAVIKGGSEVFVQKAKEWLDKGYYTRSILYSEFAVSLSESQKPQWIFAAAFVLIIFAVYFVLRKKEDTYEKKIERKLYSFD